MIHSKQNQLAREPLRHLLLLFPKITITPTYLRRQLSARSWEVRAVWAPSFSIWTFRPAGVAQFLRDCILGVRSLKDVLSRSISKPSLAIVSSRVCRYTPRGLVVSRRTYMGERVNGSRWAPLLLRRGRIRSIAVSIGCISY